MRAKEELKSRNVPLVLRYYKPNQNKNPEAYAHHLLFMFYLFRKEEELLSENSSYIEKLNKPEVLTTINRNQQLIQPFSDIVQEAYENFLNDQINLPYDPSGRQENAETNVDQENHNEDEEHDNSFHAAEFSVASFLLPDDDINARIRHLNDEQRDIFNFVLISI